MLYIFIASDMKKFIFDIYTIPLFFILIFVFYCDLFIIIYYYYDIHYVPIQWGAQSPNSSYNLRNSRFVFINFGAFNESNPKRIWLIKYKKRAEHIFDYIFSGIIS